MAKTIVLHCGVSKTGTSSLQKHFDRHSSILDAAGISFPPRMISQGRLDPLLKTFEALRRDKDCRASCAAAKKILRELLNNRESVLISDETILGQPFNQGSFYAAMDISIERLNRVFEGHNVQIVLCLRRQSELLNSYYSQYLRAGGEDRFSDYLAKWENVNLSWTSYLGKLARNLRHSDSAVFHYDKIDGRLVEIQEACLSFAGVGDNGQPIVKLPPNPYHANVSFKQHAFPFARRFNSTWSRFGLNKQHKVRRHVVEGIGRWSIGIFGKPAGIERLREVERRYRAENQLISSMSGSTIEEVLNRTEIAE